MIYQDDTSSNGDAWNTIFLTYGLCLFEFEWANSGKLNLKTELLSPTGQGGSSEYS